MRAIGLAALTVLELPPPEHIAIAAQAGYSHVGLRLVPVAGQPYQHPHRIEEIEKRLADTGIRVLDVEVFRLAPETRVADFAPALAQAQRLGASEILVHGADPDEARLADRFGALCDLAARYDLSASIEPMPWVEVCDVAKAARVLRAAGRTNSALLVDAIHFFRAGDSFPALREVPMRYAQLCDARPERPSDLQEVIRQARGDRLFPGEGGLDLAGLLRALPPELPLSLEIPVSTKMPALDRARRALEATRELLACV